MLKRKFKKLVNNPKLFFSDMAIKHRNKIGYFKPKKMDGHFQYTVVSAVYNVEQYLNDYFNGFIKQRLDFKRHIKLILVDDGSKDNSADIIKRWQKKYPNNITYIYKENGGQASARNLGLEHVTTEWVTFIDPDDFVDSDYFYSTDNELEKLNGKSIAYAACNIVLYNEDSNTFSNKHPLAYKFNWGSQVISVSDNRNLQLSSASAFFNINTIKKHNVKFPENVKPTFEDAYFINSITKHEDSCLVISNAHYFYRRRDDNNSTVDLSWEKPERYTTIFENGYTKLLKESIDPSGKIPKHIQRVVFYDLAWYIKRFVFHSRKFQQLPPEWQASLKKNLKETISFIDDDVILDYNLAGFWWFYKYGTILYKNSDVKSGHSLYLHSVDQSKKLIEVSFFCAENMSNESFEINGIDTIPHYFKDTHHKLCDDFFIQERKAWIPYENINQKISAKLAGVNRSITIVEGGRTQASHKIADIISHFKAVHAKKLSALPTPSRENRDKYANSWILMDRDYQADDNAEHLYKYIQSNVKSQKIFFAIRKNTPDWHRLKSLGFNLINYDGPEFYDAIRYGDMFISSHNAPALMRKFKHDVLFDKKFIFLQHGIICSDLSSAYNSSKIDLFITSGILEYKSIADSPSPYKLTSKEVKLTGLPRHDSLIRNDENITPDSIVIMPTWREYLVGKFVGDGLLRDSNDDFMSSEYALNWSMFLHSNGLKNYALEKKLKIKFFPHAEILPYIKQLDIPQYIDVVTSVDSSIQNVFHSSAIFITDFSSVGFEVGLLRKHILYFQFDYDEFFSNHSKKGYFDYKADGFGPVSYTTDELLENLYEIKSIDLDQNSIYYKRQSTFFKYYDNNSCQRVYTSIKNLHSMDSIENTNLNTLKIYAKQAEKQNAWSLAQTRWERAHINKSHVTDGLENIKYIISLRKQGKLAQAEQFISEHYPINNTYQDSITHEKARIAMAKHEWLVAIQYWKKTTLEGFDCYLDYIQCLAELELTLEVDQAIKTSLHTHNHPCSKLVIVWSDIAKKQWKNAAKKLELMIPACSRENLIKYKLQIVLARCLREQGLFIESHEKLQSFEKISKATILFREEAAQLAYAREYWDKVISQVKAAYVEPINMPYPIATILLKSLQLKASNIALIISENNSDEILSLKIKAYREQGKLNHAKHLVDSRLKVSSNKVISSEIFSESAQLAMDNYQWELALSYLDMINTRDDHTYILKIICFSELGSHKAIKRLTLDKNWFDKLDKTLSTFVHALYAIARRDWLQAERYLESSLLYANKKAIFDYKLELRLSRVKRELNQFNDAHALLVAYERHTTNDPKCREEIAKLAYSKCLWDKTISQLDKAYPNDIDYSESVALLMLSALEKKSQHERISTILMKMPQLNIRGYKKASSVVSRHNSNSTSPQTLIN